jgi:hypothetical protein
MHGRAAVVKRLISRSLVFVVILHTLGCGSTSVTQVTGPDSARCEITLSSTPVVPAAGGRVEIGLVAQRECGWTAASEASWLQVSPASGQGEAAIVLTAIANPQALSRTGNLVVNGTRYAITQAASPCTFTLTPTSTSVPASGGTTHASIASLVGCSWTTASTAAWISVTPAAASGSGEVTVTAEANTSTSPRSATATIAGKAFTVNQAAAAGPAPAPEPGPSPSPSPPAPGCSYDIDPAIRSFKDKGGDATVKVITDATCGWTAASTVDWIQIKENASGTGTRDVKYHVTENKSLLGRIGTITIAGRTHTVLQAGQD